MMENHTEALAGIADAKPMNDPRITPVATTRYPTLTKAEWRVCEGLVSGLTLTQVAYKIGLSVNTVKTHVKRIYKKYAVHTQPELIIAVLKSRDARSHEDWLRLKDFAP